jgi:hypothetical protein
MVYSLENTQIPKAFITPHQGDDVSRATKGITSATVTSKAIIATM